MHKKLLFVAYYAKQTYNYARKTCDVILIGRKLN